MRNYFTSQGLLDDGMQMAGLSTIGRYDQEQDPLRKFQEFVPRDENELVSMQRTMIPTGNQSNDGTPTFITPEGAQYQQNIGLMQEVQTKAMSDFQKKVQNPFFKITDFAADAIRNTIGMPGGGLKADPSATAKSELQMKLQGLDMAAQQNATNLITAREARDQALSEVFKDKTDTSNTSKNSKASGVPKLNSAGEFVQMYEDGSSVPITDADGNPVKALDKSKIHMVNGLPNRWNPVTEAFEPVGDAKAFLKEKTRQLETQLKTEARNAFDLDRPKLNSALYSAETKTTLLKKKINEAREIMRTNRSAVGVGGLWRSLPTSAAKKMEGILKTLQANVAFATLQEMRANSKTGGALGNVSDTEIGLLYSALGSLDQLTTVDQLLNTFADIEFSADRAMTGLQRAFNAERSIHYPNAEDDTYEDDIYTRDYFIKPQGAQSSIGSDAVNDDELNKFDQMFDL